MAENNLNEMNSLTDIANIALVMIKERTISNLNDDDEKENAIRQLLPMVIYNVQNSTKWQELLTHADLSLAEDKDFNGWYKYNLPAEFLQFEVITNENWQGDLEYKLEGGFVLVKHDKATCKYYRKNLDPAKWSDELKECVATLLASRLATYLTGDFKVGLELEDRYEQRQKYILKNVKNIKNSSAPQRKLFGNWNIRGRR